VTEGDDGTVNAAFNVLLLPVSTQTVTVVAQTANDTATAGLDYTPVSPVTLTFSPGTRLQTVTVPVRGDLVTEADETFFVSLSGATNATIGRAQAVGTIVDDDLPNAQVDDVTVVEGDSGSVDAVFTVSLTSPSDQTVVVVAEVRTAARAAATTPDRPGPADVPARHHQPAPDRLGLRRPPGRGR
jgi:hypothetical protein